MMSQNRQMYHHQQREHHTSEKSDVLGPLQLVSNVRIYIFRRLKIPLLVCPPNLHNVSHTG